MRKYRPYIIAFILIIIILFFLNRLYIAIIMHKTYNAMMLKANENNFYVKKIQSENELTNITEVCIKNGIFVRNSIGIFKDNIYTVKYWEDNDSIKGKSKYYIIASKGNEIISTKVGEIDNVLESKDAMYKYTFANSLIVGNGEFKFDNNYEYTFNDFLIYSLINCFGKNKVGFKMFSDKENCYEIHYTKVNIYINKDTYLQELAINSDESIIYEYFTRDVLDYDIEEPDINKIENN